MSKARGPRRSWTIYSVDARVGAPGRGSAHRDLARLVPLPSAAAPFVMFTGVMAGGHAAVFSLGAGIEGRGPGLCRPSHAHCVAIVLAPRQTERLAVPTAGGGSRTVLLKVSRVARRVTRSRTAALSAFRRVSQAGRCELGLASPLTYDATSGLLSRVSAGVCRHVKSPVAFPGPTS